MRRFRTLLLRGYQHRREYASRENSYAEVATNGSCRLNIRHRPDGCSHVIGSYTMETMWASRVVTETAPRRLEGLAAGCPRLWLFLVLTLNGVYIFKKSINRYPGILGNDYCKEAIGGIENNQISEIDHYWYIVCKFTAADQVKYGIPPLPRW